MNTEGEVVMPKLLFFSTLSLVAMCGCGNQADKEKPSEPNQAGNASEHRKKAIAAAQKLDWDTAIKECNEAIRLDPKDVNGWWVRGMAHLKKKELAKAEEDCSEALKLDAKFAPALRERGLAHLGQKKYKEAIADFTSFIELRANDPEGYRNRAQAHAGSGNNTAATADLDKAESLKKKKK
jgi:tetratricopeptide (TPR) repeat protein